MTRKAQVLLVMNRDKQDAFRRDLGPLGAAIDVAATCREAGQFFRTRRAPAVVVTAATLSDGSWLTVLQEALPCGRLPEVIVCSDSAFDNVHLRPHVQAYGCYALLPHPCDSDALRKAIEAAFATSRLSRRAACKSAVGHAGETAPHPPSAVSLA